MTHTKPNYWLFALLVVFNAAFMYWVAATPEFINVIGMVYDQYVMPGVFALLSAKAMFWAHRRLTIISENG